LSREETLNRLYAFSGAVLVLAATLSLAQAETLQVGPERVLKLPSAAAAAAHDGDVVEIDAGDYPGDVAVWRQNDLTVRGVGGRPRILGTGRFVEDRGLWAALGNNFHVENIEFADSRVPGGNGAGILASGRDLTVSDCIFRDNEDGILATVARGDIVIERSEFAHNGTPNGQTHGIYIGRARSLTVRGSYFHDTTTGHHLKSRALTNFILDNRFIDGERGSASYAIEFPNGGRAIILGNVIEKGRRAQNLSMIAYGLEGELNPSQTLLIAYNTLVSENFAATFLYSVSATPLYAIDNIFVGPGEILRGPGKLVNNLYAAKSGRRPAVLDAPGNSGNRVVTDAGFADAAARDYHLATGSPAIGMAVVPPTAQGLIPKAEPETPIGSHPRESTKDIGAYESSPAEK
jgi:hypothetical protein